MLAPRPARADRAPGAVAAALEAATASEPDGPSEAQRRLARTEDLNYLALGACILVSNLWFLLSVMQFR